MVQIHDKSFSIAGKLKMHIRSVHEGGNKDYKCNYCGKSSSRANNLKKHILIVHKGHKDHKCVSCSKSFSTAVSLKNHIVLKQDI